MINATMNNPEALLGKGVGFERIRRITGYLVGTLDRFNNAKRAEVRDRVVHSTRRLAAGSCETFIQTGRDRAA